MALELNGTTGVSLVQDGVITDANLPAGSVLQVVSSSSSSTFSTTNTSYTDTGFSASITPSSTSSKVLVLFSSVGGGLRTSGECDNQFGLTRDNGSTFLTVKRTELYDYGGSGVINRTSVNINYVDSPSSASAVTYKIYAKVNNASDVFLGSSSGSVTEFILMEIAG